jgi:DNA primase
MKVVDLLQERRIEFKGSGRDYLVRCLNPDHEDKHPSMRIDTTTGIFNCFSCGYKGNIFKEFNAPSNYLEIKRQRLMQAIEEKRSSSVGIPFPKGHTPYTGNWRGIKPETYKHFDAFEHHDTQFVGRVVFPIRDITGKVVAFNGRHLNYIDKVKYMIHPPHATMPLYPASVKTIKGRVILVEGIFDMINLFDKGLFNTICCFGTNTVTPDKLAILKMQDIMGVDIIFDGDEPGRRAAENLVFLTERAGLVTRNIDLGQDVDPGSLTQEKVQKLIGDLYE